MKEIFNTIFLLICLFSYYLIIVLCFEIRFRKTKKMEYMLYGCNALFFLIFFLLCYFNYDISKFELINIIYLLVSFIIIFLPSIFTFIYFRIKKFYSLYLILTIFAWIFSVSALLIFIDTLFELV